MNKALTILVVDDHPFFRSAIVSVLQPKEYCDRIIEASDGNECLEILAKTLVDIVLLDISMPGMDGIECLNRIRENSRSQRVIILTQFADAKIYRSLMSMGANGYLVKSTTEEQFTRDFEDVVFSGQTVIGEGLKTIESTDAVDKAKLGEREKEVFALILRHFTTPEIAEQLGISAHTVKNHRKSISKKLGTNSLAEMMKWAEENKFI